MARMEQVVCPKCGKMHEMEVFEVVNVAMQPELKEAVLDRSIFGFECPECKTISEYVYNVWYHDPEKKMMIFLAGSSDEDEAERAIIRIIENSRTQNPFADMGYTLRIVRNPQQLREKILIADFNRDDRVIEVCKHYALGDFLNQVPNVQIVNIIYDTVNGGKEAIALIDHTGMDHDLEVTDIFYDFIQELIADGLAKLSCDVYEVVDFKWAEEFLTKMYEEIAANNQ